MNYRETNIAGTSWQRACRVVIENPLNGTPHILFVEEQVVNVGDDRITRPVANVSCQFNPTATIPIINPETGLPTGATATHRDVYAILYSLYMQLANARDAQSP